VARFTPLSLLPRGKIPRYSLDRRLGEPYTQSGICGKYKNSHDCLCRELNLGGGGGVDHPLVYSLLNELPRLLFNITSLSVQISYVRPSAKPEKVKLSLERIVLLDFIHRLVSQKN
jgi:hypothetical protein